MVIRIYRSSSILDQAKIQLKAQQLVSSLVTPENTADAPECSQVQADPSAACGGSWVRAVSEQRAHSLGIPSRNAASLALSEKGRASFALPASNCSQFGFLLLQVLELPF